MNLDKEIKRRRTFAIISHPDAGKTTITEKLLLYGGAIQLAGTVKAKRSKKFATSDWMELEKQRGISVTSSVMKFPYKDHEINLIDTPGHEDFSEDTYRTLTAVDSALMLIDCANGVEAQTKKLFHVCHMRKTPVMTFINKMDREGRDLFELLEEIEQVLGIATYPVTWPIGRGGLFRGVYHRETKELILYEKDSDRSSRIVPLTGMSLESEELEKQIGAELAEELRTEIELLDGAGDHFDKERYLKGEIAPVFFGSALNNFGVQTLLDYLVSLAPKPLPRSAVQRTVDPAEKKFTSFIFKIQANMDPSHRDRVAFMRICSGRFERGMKAHHVRHKRAMRLGRPTQFMAQDRSLVDEAFAGDIVGIHDPGVFKIGDTLSEGETLSFTGIPVFAPEHFVRVQLKDPLKSKQLNKGLDQLAEEGAVQIFRPINSNDQYLGVVGILQIDVVKYRIKAEYGVTVDMKPLPYTAARWISAEDPKKLEALKKEQANNICLDTHGNPTLFLDHDWRLKFHQERHPEVEFHTTSEAVSV
ncbi:MAG: peptide chain release factor 3 [Oligoflexales bacterium]|nr:peptide chain release factor 3 [Oligoflexales bacterium]